MVEHIVNTLQLFVIDAQIEMDNLSSKLNDLNGSQINLLTSGVELISNRSPSPDASIKILDKRLNEDHMLQTAKSSS